MEYYKNQCKKGFPNLNHLDLSTPYLITSRQQPDLPEHKPENIPNPLNPLTP